MNEKQFNEVNQTINILFSLAKKCEGSAECHINYIDTVEALTNINKNLFSENQNAENKINELTSKMNLINNPKNIEVTDE